MDYRRDASSKAKHGFSVTESRFDEWVERGLMGEAEMRTRPGRGSSVWWPDAQLTLFLDLLAFRQHTSLKQNGEFG